MASNIQGDNIPPELIITSTDNLKKRAHADSGSEAGTRPASPSEEPVLARGNLQKLGKRFKAWHHRYFEIQGSHMYYYKNTSKRDFLGEIRLSIALKCGPTSAATFGSPFEIVTSERSHVLAARSKEEMQQWIDVIKQNMGKVKNKGAPEKSAKVKKWETFKRALGRGTRSPSPAIVAQKSSAQNAKKDTKKTFAHKFKLKKKKTPPGHNQEVEAKIPDNKRPMSLHGDDLLPMNTLDIFKDHDTSVSLPASPISKKKDMLETPTPPSPLSFTPDSPISPIAPTSDSHDESTPVHEARGSVTEAHINDTSPSRSSSPPPVFGDSTGEQIEIRVEIENDTTEAKPPTPTVEVKVDSQKDEPFVPKYLKDRTFLWDKVREFLDDTPKDESKYEDSEVPPLPEEAMWMEKETSIEQLRAFLTLCP